MDVLERRKVTLHPGAVVCPDCGHEERQGLPPLRGAWLCPGCGRRAWVAPGLDDQLRAYQLCQCPRCGQVVGFDLFNRVGFHEMARGVTCLGAGLRGLP